MLQFVYAGSLSTAILDAKTNVQSLVDLLLVGDKFEVRSFMGAVLRALSGRKSTVPDTVELALRVPEVLEQHPQIKELVTKARDRLLETFKDADAWCDSTDFLGLEQDAVRFLLQSEGLKAESEAEIFQGTAAWVCKNMSTLKGRQEAMEDFSRFIRFGCMRGEFLIDHVFPDSLMVLPETQKRVKEGVRFQAYSDERKTEIADPSVRERRGIRDARLEIVCNLAMQENGSPVDSQPATWLGRVWMLHLRQLEDTGSISPKVGLSVTSKLAPNNQRASSKVNLSFYVRTWPSGFWKSIRELKDQKLAGKFSNWGLKDALGVPWREARTSKKFIGPTGEISVKVLIRMK